MKLKFTTSIENDIMDFTRTEDKLKEYARAETGDIIRNVKCYNKRQLLIVTYTKKVGQRWDLIDRILIDFIENKAMTHNKMVYTTNGVWEESY